MLWTWWFLEIVTQIDPRFRRELRTLGGTVQDIASAAYEKLGEIGYSVEGNAIRPIVKFNTDKGRTLFCIFRSLYWECAKNELETLEASKDPEDDLRADLLRKLLSDPLRVDFVVLLSLLPFDNVPSLKDLATAQGANLSLPKLGPALKHTQHQFGNLLTD
jgi:hypothetical protein